MTELPRDLQAFRKAIQKHFNDVAAILVSSRRTDSFLQSPPVRDAERAALVSRISMRSS